eukprot:5475126-Amphidinium_carterae.1
MDDTLSRATIQGSWETSLVRMPSRGVDGCYGLRPTLPACISSGLLAAAHEPGTRNLIDAQVLETHTQFDNWLRCTRVVSVPLLNASDEGLK